tara:strand:- start:53 stop:349 length:297 start_codon:yes stop_codon:yes gene_type:complete
MLKKKRFNYTKKDISKNISIKLGLSNSYSSLITDSLIEILKQLVGAETTNIKNFGTFKILKKNERLGRNPKNNVTYIISARKSISFISSKKLSSTINK